MSSDFYTHTQNRVGKRVYISTMNMNKHNRNLYAIWKKFKINLKEVNIYLKFIVNIFIF